MKLLLCGPGHPFRGGIARTTTELAKVLVERGHDLVYLTPTRQYLSWLYPGGEDRDPKACERLECAVECIDPMWPPSWQRQRRQALGAGAEAWIFPYWTLAWAPWWWYLLRAAKRPPAFAVVHNPVDHDRGRLARWLAGSVLGGCQGLMTHAEVLAGRLQRWLPDLPVVSHPLPAVAGRLPDRTEARRDLGLAADLRIALFFGLIRPYKGVDVLLEAFSQLGPASGWHLIIAGEPWGSLGESIIERCAAPDLDDRVLLDLTWVSEEAALRYIAAADVVVLPYRDGTQSAVAPTALAHGRPVISTEVGGLAEVVNHNLNGLVVPPDDPDALAGAVRSLDERALRRLAKGAVATSASSGWHSYAEVLEHLLEQHSL